MNCDKLPDSMCDIPYVSGVFHLDCWKMRKIPSCVGKMKTNLFSISGAFKTLPDSICDIGTGQMTVTSGKLTQLPDCYGNIKLTGNQFVYNNAKDKKPTGSLTTLPKSMLNMGTNNLFVCAGCALDANTCKNIVKKMKYFVAAPKEIKRIVGGCS